MFDCTCYDFRAAKNEVSDVYWLHLHCPVMETHDANLVKCFSEKRVSYDKREEVHSFSERYVV